MRCIGVCWNTACVEDVYKYVHASRIGLEEINLVHPINPTFVSGSRMSDARAKAEARRAKILARDSSKKVQAIGDDVSTHQTFRTHLLS